jgi:LysR substrate binding domain
VPARLARSRGEGHVSEEQIAARIVSIDCSANCGGIKTDSRFLRLESLVRLAVKPNDPDSYYASRELVPATCSGTCASPDYLRRHGTPRTPDDLSGHRMIGFVSSATGSLLPLEFTVDGALRHVTLPAAVSVAGAETIVALARLGLGLVQGPRYHVEADLAAGIAGGGSGGPRALADAGVRALSAEPPAVAPRAGVQRLARNRVYGAQHRSSGRTSPVAGSVAEFTGAACRA